MHRNVTVLFLVLVSWCGVRLSPLGTSATNWPILSAPDDDECGAVSRMKIGGGNRRTRRKPAPVPLCPPQIPHDLTWPRTRAAAVGSRRLTAWAMARPASKRNARNDYRLPLCRPAQNEHDEKRTFNGCHRVKQPSNRHGKKRCLRMSWKAA
jgi:hypothetical protein